jgi:CRP-like cAMP-binding protein
LPEIATTNGISFIAHAQTAGGALRIKGQTLLTFCRQEPALFELLFGYSQTLTAQIAQTMTCHFFHSLEQRLARWLLMARDRTAADTFHLAHEHFARTLGVSRSNISTVTGVLKKKRLIRCERKSITICNHARLEATVCECYQVISQAINTSLPAPALSKTDKVSR